VPGVNGSATSAIWSTDCASVSAALPIDGSVGGRPLVWARHCRIVIALFWPVKFGSQRDTRSSSTSRPSSLNVSSTLAASHLLPE
jgi:hypothetical protein